MIDPDSRPVSATLSEYLTKLAADAEGLRTDVHNAEQARRRANTIGLALMGVLGFLMLVILVVAAQNNAIASQTRQTNARIAACTTAGGKCYEDGKTRTGAAVGDIVKASVYVAECSRLHPGESGPTFDAFLEKCVAGKLAKASPPAPVPSPTG